MKPIVPPKAALVTLGCPMNQVDSERIMGGLVSLGFEITPEEDADVIVVNTCGFIESAREESVETIMSIAELKESGRLKSLVVAGCLAERYREELERDLAEADAVVGLAERDAIPQLCLDLLGRSGVKDPAYSRVVTGPLNTAYLKIAEGCDNRCSYCAIPMIRGRFRSIPEDTVVTDAEELVSLGGSELILIAQDTTAYGADLGTTSLPRLLKRLDAIEGLSWIRLLYANPSKFTDELTEAVADIPSVIPYIDIPVQHIARPVLKRMGRPSDPDVIKRLIDRLRTRIEGVVLRTSVMVGFPGETDKDFEELLSFVEEARFERLGAFIYSPEEGTRAADFEDTVPEDTALGRYERIMELQATLSGTFHRSLVGREFDMIVDDADPDNGTITGRTYMDAPDIDGSVTAAGAGNDNAFRRIRITAAGQYDLEGEIID